MDTSKKLASKLKQEMKLKDTKPQEAHHTGKGTPARLNTAAEKQFFNSQYSK